MQAAEKRGKWAVGQASDMSHFGPNAHCSAERLVCATTSQRFEGHGWQLNPGLLGRHGGQRDPYSGTTRKSRRLWCRSEEDRRRHQGWTHLFTGPIKDQTGKVRVPAGKTMTNGELAGKNWYVQGVEGWIK